MEIYNYEPDRLIQCCEAYQDESGTWLPKPCTSVEDMDGAAAVKEIREALDAGCEPLVVNGKVMGSHYGERSYIYCDCDEQTYEEYYGFPYED